MRRRNKLAHFSVLILLTAGILYCPEAVIAQASSSDPEVHVVEPIITEETMPNEPGDWDLRFSGSYSWQGGRRLRICSSHTFFFGIANRWGGEIEVPLAFARQDANHYGIGDISATVKYLVRKPTVRVPGFVLGLETTFPSGNAANGLGEGVFEAVPFVAMVYASRRVVLQGNFGYSLVHRIQETGANNQIVYNGAVEFPFPRLNTWVLGEINGTHDKGIEPRSLRD